MTLVYVLAPYVRRDFTAGGIVRPRRAPIVYDLDATIHADGGTYDFQEVAGDRAVVKVRASAAVIAQIAALPGVRVITRADAVRALATPRRKPRYDPVTDTIVCDGPEQACGTIASLDRRVP